MDPANAPILDQVLPVDAKKNLRINQLLKMVNGEVERIMVSIRCTEKGIFFK